MRLRVDFWSYLQLLVMVGVVGVEVGCTACQPRRTHHGRQTQAVREITINTLHMYTNKCIIYILLALSPGSTHSPTSAGRLISIGRRVGQG